MSNSLNKIYILVFSAVVVVAITALFFVLPKSSKDTRESRVDYRKMEFQGVVQEIDESANIYCLYMKEDTICFNNEDIDFEGKVAIGDSVCKRRCSGCFHVYHRGKSGKFMKRPVRY